MEKRILANKNHHWVRFAASILSLCLCFNLTGQNLVRNCDFEVINACPTASGQLEKATNCCAPGTGTSDLCHLCGGTGVGVPYNLWGTQEAFSGDSYAHIICYYPTYGNDYREYIQTELACELKAGKEYKATFYMSISDNSRYTVDGLGLHFSVEPLAQSGNNIIDLDVPVNLSLPHGTIVYDKELWTVISGIYQASGGEKYITIGNFTPEEELIIYTYPGITTTYNSIYIDMVSVEPFLSLKKPVFIGLMLSMRRDAVIVTA